MTEHLGGEAAAERQTQEAIDDENERYEKWLSDRLRLGWAALAAELES